MARVVQDDRHRGVGERMQGKHIPGGAAHFVEATVFHFLDDDEGEEAVFGILVEAREPQAHAEDRPAQRVADSLRGPIQALELDHLQR
jgi:hypothetical protein